MHMSRLSLDCMVCISAVKQGVCLWYSCHDEYMNETDFCGRMDSTVNQPNMGAGSGNDGCNSPHIVGKT